jgi:hypothetical protein
VGSRANRAGVPTNLRRDRMATMLISHDRSARQLPTGSSSSPTAYSSHGRLEGARSGLAPPQRRLHGQGVRFVQYSHSCKPDDGHVRWTPDEAPRQLAVERAGPARPLWPDRDPAVGSH